MIDSDIQTGTKVYTTILGEWVEIKEIEVGRRSFFKAITESGYIELFQGEYIKKYTNRDYTLNYLNTKEI